MALSSAAQVLVAIIPIVGIVMGAVIAFFYLLWSHREKVRLIERGLYEARNVDLDAFCLLTGMVLVSIGIVLSVLFLAIEGFSYSPSGGSSPSRLASASRFLHAAEEPGRGMSANDRRVATSDEEAIGQVLDGDTEAFAILVRRHSARVKRLGMSFFRRRGGRCRFHAGCLREGLYRPRVV